MESWGFFALLSFLFGTLWPLNILLSLFYSGYGREGDEAGSSYAQVGEEKRMEVGTYEREVWRHGPKKEH